MTADTDSIRDKSLAPNNTVIVLFGATGDLAKRKLLPGLFHLFLSELMPNKFRIIGTASTKSAHTNESFVGHVKASLKRFGRKEVTDTAFTQFSQNLSFMSTNTSDLSDLNAAIQAACSEIGDNCNVVFYLAVPAQAFIPIVKALGKVGIAKDSKLVIEKPFGSDLDSAKELNSVIHSTFNEHNVYRIDHFLGKESVQNILALRFANGIFEPAWDKRSLDHVQIDVPETLTIEGRGKFYEETGAYRDMVVTHLLQVLGFIAMDPPKELNSADLNYAKDSVFQAIRPLTKSDVVFGQYVGYLSEQGVLPNSKVETFVAARVWIDNERWLGVPFYLRTGKALTVGKSVVTLSFRIPKVTRFDDHSKVDQTTTRNELIIEFGDPGSINVKFLAKKPGATMALTDGILDFSCAECFNTQHGLEAYERLLHDVLISDRTLFNSAIGIERLWEISEGLLEDPPNPFSYDRGSFGPQEADVLISPNLWHLR